MSIVVSKNAQNDHPLIDLGSGASIDDVYSTEDSEKPLSGGIFKINKNDTKFVYTYNYHEVKIILSGTIILEDIKTGINIVATTGDVLRIAKGTEVTFSSPDSGVAFYVGQRAWRDF